MTIAEKGIAILKQYAKESGVLLRSTSDLSPLEQWLTLQLINKQISDEEIEKEAHKQYPDNKLCNGCWEIWVEGAKYYRDKQKG